MNDFSKADEIKKLKDLLDSGAITQSEFDQQKQRLLNETPQRPQFNQATTQVQPNTAVWEGKDLYKKQKKHKKQMSFMKVALVIMGIVFFGVIITNAVNPDALKSPTSSTSSSATDTPESLLALDKESWEQFKNLYISHNNFMEAIETYSSGNASNVDFYNYCKDMKEYFSNASTKFSYGKTQTEKDYLDVFQSWSIYDQWIAEDLMKYMDSGKTSDLSKATENIDLSKQAVLLISKNRGVLLKQAGLTDEELAEKIEKDTAELEELGKAN